jgi:hypothetical protein
MEENVIIRDQHGRFKPGVSGNPGGRSREAAELDRALREIVDPQVLAHKLWSLAEEGNLAAIKYIYDRLDGKPTERIETIVANMPKVIGYYPTEDGDEAEDE